MTKESHPIGASSVLSEAVTNVAQRLEISDEQLARILGTSPKQVARLHNGDYGLDGHSSEWLRAQLFV